MSGGIMEFRIADTFTDSLGRLTGGEQKAVKTIAPKAAATFSPRIHRVFTHLSMAPRPTTGCYLVPLALPAYRMLCATRGESATARKGRPVASKQMTHCDRVGRGAMEPQESAPRVAVPYLVAALVCDAAVADPSTGKKNLIGIFDRLWVGTFPTTRAMTVYIKLTDAEGKYKIEVRLYRVDTATPLAGALGEATFANRLQSSDMFIAFPPLPIPEAGRYEFRVLANDTYLGGTFIDAFPRQPKTEG